MCRSGRCSPSERSTEVGATYSVPRYDGGAEATLRGEAPFATGVRYGPLRMARMLAWTVIGRLRSRHAGRVT